MNSLRLVVLVTFALFILPVAAREPDAARVTVIAEWLPARPTGIAPANTNREFWTAPKQVGAFASAIPDAAKHLKSLPPIPSDDLYLEFSRNGNRTRWQNAANARRRLLSVFVLAECVEGQGRFLPPLEKLIAEFCAERTWVMPAHDRSLKNFRGEATDIDLAAAALGWNLATTDALLGDALSPAMRQLIRQNLERRVFASFRSAVTNESGNWWLKATHNWNAVCLAGVNGAAQAILESPRDRAWFIATSESHVRNFLIGFTPDGYCSEGVGYWNYGFGHFTLLAESIRRDTGGKLDLLAAPQARQPALFGFRTEILAGMHPSIADCSPSARPDQQLVQFLARRFALSSDELNNPGRSGDRLYEALLYATTPTNLPTISLGDELADLPLRTWFADGGVLICRPAPDATTPFAACMKGGHNNEHHNHNDVGTFMVACGKTMVLCDPGAETYTARTFSSKRYESKVLNSYGHPVPVIAGRLQRTGADARGVVLDSAFSPGQDRLRIDFRSAYDAPELTRLEREFVFQRGAQPSFTVTDHVVFSKASTYETALITWSKWQRISDHELLIGTGTDAVRVRLEAGGAAVTIRGETLEEDVSTRQKPVRIGLQLKAPVEELEFKLSITPARQS